MSKAQSNDASAITIDFEQRSELANWIVVNDTVMGGRSRTRLDLEQGYLSFAGILSLENNGGFASIRRVYDSKNWLPNTPIKLQVLGDGRTYQFRLRTNRRADGVAYAASFNTQANTLITVKFTEADFVPQFRGRLVQGAPDLNFADIEQMGIMLTDKKPGEFALQLHQLSQGSS